MGKRRVLSPGDTVLDGRYTIIKVIHASGMANVYLVEDKNLNKQWCLKEIIKSEAGKDEIEYRSIIREANIMKRLSHASIPRITTIEEDGDSIFIVMDYVDGLSVKEWLIRKGSVEQKTAVSWIKQVCGVMIYLHNREQPIFYRDMKPDNIMIQSDGNIRVIDFGISEVMTEKNKVIKEALGTRGFAAPEQKKKGLPYDLRSDIFGIGRTLYYMLTGLNPSVLNENLTPIREVNPSISVGLEKVVNKCMEPDVNNRYQSVEEVLYDLQNYDKLDQNYIKRLRRKVNLVSGLFLGSLFLLCLSVVPFLLESSRKNNEYNTLLSIAEKSGSERDYIAVLDNDPSDVRGYVGYVEVIKQDGVFSKNEEETLLNRLNPELSELESKQGYGDLAYEIGRLYWFYYEGDLSDNMVLSVKWFEDAMTVGTSNEQEAKILYNLGSFKKNLSMSIAEASDTGMYADYWNGLMSAKDYNSGEIVELQINKAIVDAISSYVYRLKLDGVGFDEIQSEVERISGYISNVTPQDGKPKELYDELVNSYNRLGSIEDIESRYKGGD